MLAFYGEAFLAPRPTPKLEDHLLSFFRGCLFNIFAANLQLEVVHPRRWIDNIKIDLLEMGLNVVDWIGLVQDRYSW
jgi:hypothetical protein